MDPADIGLFSLAERRLAWVDQRQALLSSRKLDRAHERAVDGNTVGLEDQLARVAESDGTQQLVTGLYHKYMGLFMTAFGKSS